MEEAEMHIEIHKPELEQRVRRRIQSGQYHDVDELLTKALDALDEKAAPMSSDVEALRQKNFVELCDPVRGLAEDIDFSRNPSTARPLDL
jgi:Arc/MetJ-type ribon-helix-helix transcriptional regulator